MSLNQWEACLVDSWMMSLFPTGHAEGKEVLEVLLNPLCKQKCNNMHTYTERLSEIKEIYKVFVFELRKRCVY